MKGDFFCYINDRRSFKDFNIIQYGYRKCQPGFAPSRLVRKTYLFHYVYSGEGYLEADGKRFYVKKNQGFVIFPDQLATYISSEEDPFVYRWIEFEGFQGDRLCGFAGLSRENPVFTDNAPFSTGKLLKRIVDSEPVASYILQSKFYEFAQSLCLGWGEDDKVAGRYVDSAINYIAYHKSAKLTVAEVAEHVCLSRAYISKIFLEKTGMTIKQYILDRAMSSARMLLQNRRLSVGEIASILGYENTAEFTKAFRRYSGTSPSAYRQKLKGEG